MNKTDKTGAAVKESGWHTTLSCHEGPCECQDPGAQRSRGLRGLCPKSTVGPIRHKSVRSKTRKKKGKEEEVHRPTPRDCCETVTFNCFFCQNECRRSIPKDLGKNVGVAPWFSAPTLPVTLSRPEPSLGMCTFANDSRIRFRPHPWHTVHPVEYTG